MKFSKSFSFYKIPEWQEYYFDYYTLKIILYFIANKIKKKKALIKTAKTTSKLTRARLSAMGTSNTNLRSHASSEFIKLNDQKIKRSTKTRKSLAILRRGSTIKYDEEININNFNNLLKMARSPSKKSKDSDENSVYL